MQTPAEHSHKSIPLPQSSSAAATGWISSSEKSFGSNGFIIESGSSGSGWKPSSSKLAVERPRRLAKPSKLKLSPFLAPSMKIHVSKLQADLYESVLELGLKKELWK